MTAIPPKSTILVTGANGYVASHVADQLLALGYFVRGTVRATSKGEAIKSALAKHNCKAATNFTYMIVQDMSVACAFDEAVKGCSGVIHLASDLSFEADPDKVITPVVRATRELLASAQKAGCVKRFVLTSSVVAASRLPGIAGDILDQSSRYDGAIAKAWSPDPGPMAATYCYVASKVQSEIEAKKFIAENPVFHLNIVRPTFNVGLIFDATMPSSSATMMREFYFHPENKQNTSFVELLTPPTWHIDVQDDARLHVAALIYEDVKDEIIYAAANPLNMNIWWDMCRRIDPTRGWPAPDKTLTVSPVKLKNERSLELIKRMGREGFMSLEESYRRCIKST